MSSTSSGSTSDEAIEQLSDPTSPRVVEAILVASWVVMVACFVGFFVTGQGGDGDGLPDLSFALLGGFVVTGLLVQLPCLGYLALDASGRNRSGWPYLIYGGALPIATVWVWRRQRKVWPLESAPPSLARIWATTVAVFLGIVALLLVVS